jgi:hypothetical protein
MNKPECPTRTWRQPPGNGQCLRSGHADLRVFVGQDPDEAAGLGLSCLLSARAFDAAGPNLRDCS